MYAQRQSWYITYSVTTDLGYYVKSYTRCPNKHANLHRNMSTVIQGALIKN